MELTTVDKRILDHVWSCAQRQQPADEQALGEAYENFSQFPRTLGFTATKEEWNEAISGLVDGGFLVRENDAYSLTEEAQTLAQRFGNEISARFFDQILLIHEQSQTYGVFCERVYGDDLTQMSMVTMPQLQQLLAVLELDEHSRVLDIGCGSGRISEYISDATQAAVTGIDFAAETIARARARTAGKRHRLTFEVGDMDDLRFPNSSFSAVISIDTIYFARDLSEAVVRMRELLIPGGQMGIFFTQSVKPDEPKERLAPETTELAGALDDASLRYRIWDLTEEECAFWRSFVAVAEELETSFEREGNTEIFKMMVFEGRAQLESVEDGRITRYLYHVQLD
jgi:SAM-dependent methyltransferase